jgi:hypothetical protein
MDGRTNKFLNLIDEYGRHCMANRVGSSCRAAEVIDTIEELLKLYPPPAHLGMNNGPEFIANILQEWCIASGCSKAYIPPGSRWENPLVESFNSGFRDEYKLTFSHRCRRPSCWLSNTDSSTKPTEQIRRSRGVRPWRSSRKGKRPDYPTALRRSRPAKGVSPNHRIRAHIHIYLRSQKFQK